MLPRTAHVEMLRWGYISIPGILFHYAQELDMDIEHLGLITAIFYTFERTRPLYNTGVQVGQVLRACPLLSKNKLSRMLSGLAKTGIIAIGDGNLAFPERVIDIEPLMEKLESFVIRDHTALPAVATEAADADNTELMNEYRQKIDQLELQLEAQHSHHDTMEIIKSSSNVNYRKVADFIAKKTGNLMSVKMATELRRWLEEMSHSPEFLLCMLELCFERSIYNPRDISKIARDLKEYSINTVEGLESYFSKCVDTEKNVALRNNQFNPDIIEFGAFTGIDMNADARKKIYYKWRYDWRFTHAMIMKAGEVMCQRTKNGGLEYMDSVLHNWMTKEIRQIDQADKEIKDFKTRSKSERKSPAAGKKESATGDDQYEIFIPPATK